tara:strand:- start:1778 stop:2206 length:429 start_codon:yes stop_codon:yes gene_type:complete
MIKPYIYRLLEAILKSNKNYRYMIEIEGHVEVKPTKDLTKCCNLKPNDNYVGVNNLDFSDIHILEYDKDTDISQWNEYYSEEHDDYVKQKHLVHVGALRWTECNTGTEKLYDYLDRNPAQELSKIIDKVSKEFEKELDILNV